MNQQWLLGLLTEVKTILGIKLPAEQMLLWDVVELTEVKKKS